MGAAAVFETAADIPPTVGTQKLEVSYLVPASRTFIDDSRGFGQRYHREIDGWILNILIKSTKKF